jgi:lactate dehydrogenase-like 2-hydroxyacid dehydrogenase
MKPLLLVLVQLPDRYMARIAESFDVHHAPDRTTRARAIADSGSAFQAVLTNGTLGLDAREIDAMPSVTLVSAQGAGYENIALEHARARGITVVNGSGTNDDCVADHAFALLLATVRDVVERDAACRRGVWRDQMPMRPSVSGKRMGIVGLGTIGEKIARRAAGFDMAIGYHNRRLRPQSQHAYFDSVDALAHWSDYLMISTPGGAGTRHLVNREVLAALGPSGFLVNIARGSVVDTAALADALRHGHIAGAGLDVYESEPEPPQVLLDLPNLVLTPHVAGTSPEAMQAAVQLFIDNALRHFAGEPVLTPL